MNALTSPAAPRLYWIDWMKAIGITLIVYGHFFSVGHQYVYTFSVPLFFIISGFLCKREVDNKVFWRKLWYNLVVPMVLIVAFSHGVSMVLALRHGVFDVYGLAMLVPKVLLGFHGGVGMMWFVYTLALMRLILQFAPRSRWLQALLFVSIPAIGIYVNDTWPEFAAKSNAILNVTTACPFFMLGFYAKRWKGRFAAPLSWRMAITGMAVCILALFVCTKLNGSVWMFVNGYGNNFALFLLGGCVGTALVFLCSKMLSRNSPPRIVNISKGTILILGFHGYFILLFRHIFPTSSLLDALASVLIVLLFIPIILFSEKHLPYLMGKYRTKH